MTLVDTSVWIDHFRNENSALVELLINGSVLIHPFVIGELAIGQLARRRAVIAELRNLPCSAMAKDEEVLNFVERHALFGLGIGYIDAHLLAAARLTPDTNLWTLDKRLAATAAKIA